MKLSQIKPNPNNPRLIKDERFEKLCKSIQEAPKFMALRPIIIDGEGMILGGNMRYKALLHLGYKEVPDAWVKRADDLTEEERHRFIISDNVGFGQWDWEAVANEWDVEELADWGLDVIELSKTDLDSFFIPKTDENEKNSCKIVLEYTLDDYELVKKELLKHGKTPEDAVYKLLNL
jgi:hypothetical protein